IPELGTRTAVVPPVAVLTSNRTRDLHDALKRRCLYHFIAYPDADRVAAIIRRRVPGIGDPLADQVAAAVRDRRATPRTRRPGGADASAWAGGLALPGIASRGQAAAGRPLAAVVKYDAALALVRQALPEVVGDG